MEKIAEINGLDTKLNGSSQQTVANQIAKITKKDNFILFSKAFSPLIYNV